MLDADRYRLRFGPYRTPRCRVGHFLKCAVRGKVRVAGLTAAPVPWPLAKSGKHLVPVVCGGLLRALRRESVQAVKHWFGISTWNAWRLRKALGFPRANEGTAALMRDLMPELIGEEGQAKMHAASTPPSGPRRSPRRSGASTAAGGHEAGPRPEPWPQAHRRSSGDDEREGEGPGAYPPAAERPFTAGEDAQLGTARDRVIAGSPGGWGGP